MNGEKISSIAGGWLILLGVTQSDTSDDVLFLVEKCTHLRAFTDADGKMNLSVLDVKGEALVVSQFTLYADCRKGRRPSFTDAAPPPHAMKLYEMFCNGLRENQLRVGTGEFGADMKVALENDGPVTFMLDSQQR